MYVLPWTMHHLKMRMMCYVVVVVVVVAAAVVVAATTAAAIVVIILINNLLCHWIPIEMSNQKQSYFNIMGEYYPKHKQDPLQWYTSLQCSRELCYLLFLNWDIGSVSIRDICVLFITSKLVIMCVCVCVCVCACVHVCVCACVRTYVRTCVCVITYILSSVAVIVQWA